MESIVNEYIHTAQTVSSKKIVEKYNLNVSSATIRNIMMRLEDKGFLRHTHTSSGRIPTNQGLRYYVDTLMDIPQITPSKRNAIDEEFTNSPKDLEYILQLTSRLLTKLSDEIGVVLAPLLFNGIIEGIDLVELVGQRFLLILQIKGGVVKSIMVESETEIEKRRLPIIKSILQERLIGHNLGDVYKRLLSDFSDLNQNDLHIVRTIINQIEQNTVPQIHNYNNYEFLNQPEFSNNPSSNSVIDLLQTENWLLKIKNQILSNDRESVMTILGNEIDFINGDNCGIMLKNYSIDNLSGVLAVVGPARMKYKEIIPMLDYIATMVKGKVSERSDH